MRTRAVRDGDHYVLNGRKLWITNAGVSDFYTVFAKTDPDAGTAGSAASSSRRTFPGFSVVEARAQARRARLADRVRSCSTSAACPAENLIGEEGRGFDYAMGALDRSRPLVGRAGARASRRARSSSRRSYVQERQQFGHAIADFQGLQFMLADMATRVDAARAARVPRVSLLDAGAARHRAARRRWRSCSPPTPRCG